MDRIKDNISLDHMARLLVDVQQDSSGIVDSIISQHQRELLNLIFLGDAPNRNKVGETLDLPKDGRKMGSCCYFCVLHIERLEMPEEIVISVTTSTNPSDPTETPPLL